MPMRSTIWLSAANVNRGSVVFNFTAGVWDAMGILPGWRTVESVSIKGGVCGKGLLRNVHVHNEEV